MLKKNIRIRPNLLGADSKFDLHTLICEEMNKLQAGWLTCDLTNTDPDKLVYRVSSKNSKLFYGFRVFKQDSRCFISPVCGTLSETEPSWYGETNTPLYAWNANLSDSVEEESLLTIGIGKHGTSCFVSVVAASNSYIRMDAVSGEESKNVFAFSPGIRHTTSLSASAYVPMPFISCDNAGHRETSVKITTFTTSGAYHYNDMYMGTVIQSSKIVLSPFVNPITGNIIEDLFTPLFGPSAESRLYDISIGNRTFVTGSSSSPATINVSLTNDEYNVVYKVFMEV